MIRRIAAAFVGAAFWASLALAQTPPGTGPMVPVSPGGGGGGSFPPSGCSTANGVIFNNATPCDSGFTYAGSGGQVSINGAALGATTGLLVNPASASGLLADFQVDGVRKASISSVGLFTGTANLGGTTTTVYHGNASGAGSFGAVNLATDVTGALLTATNAQTGTTYTFLAGDAGKLVTNSNSGATADTLPNATGNFGAGYSFTNLNLGAGAVTITPTTATINGAASVVLNTWDAVIPISDGANYQAIYVPGSLFAVAANLPIIGRGTGHAPSGMGSSDQALFPFGALAAPAINFGTSIGTGSARSGIWGVASQVIIQAGATQFDFQVNELWLESNTGQVALGNAADVTFSRCGTTCAEMDNGTIGQSNLITFKAAAFVSGGTAPTAAGSGGTCATGAIAGGPSSGTITLTGACAVTNTVTITFPFTSTTGYNCAMEDRTAPSVLFQQTSVSTTTAVLTSTGTSGATDVLQYACIGY